MDEAGYGPNLGPLLITVTKWRTPDAPHECDFYRLLKGAVQADGHDGFGRLHVADSKQVFVGKEGFRSLETTALCLLTCLGWEISSFQSLWRQLTGGADRQAGPFAPWYELDVSLPVAADRGDIDRLSQKLFQRMEKSGLALVDLRSDLVVEERFNRLADGENSNKGLALSRLAFGLLRRLWEPAADGCALVVGDKHGGRNRYDELLSEVLDGDMIFRLEERQAVSRYRIGRTELRFQVQGEAHLPVAAASIISKYMRELAMDLFNEFWGRHCPRVKPTRGYPHDARRFREEVDETRRLLGIDDLIFWRNR